MSRTSSRRGIAIGLASIAALLLSAGLTGCSVGEALTAPVGLVDLKTPSPSATGMLGGAAPAPAAAGALGAGSASTAGEDHRWPPAWDQTPPVRAGWDRAVTWTIRVAGGASLREGELREAGSWSGVTIDGAPNITDEDVNAIRGTAPAFMSRYRIHDGGKPTEFFLGISFSSPSTGSNSGSCDVFRGDPEDGGTWAWVSPYVCSVDEIRGWNPAPVFTVRKATVVTSPSRARELMNAYCTSDQPACSYFLAATDTALGKAGVVGSVVLNPGDAKGEKTIGWETTTTTENSIGVEMSAKFAIGKIFSLEVSSRYGHKWGLEHTFKEDTQIDLEPKSAQWIEFRPMMLTTLGMWVIDTPQGTFMVPDAKALSPVQDGGQIIVRTCPLDEYRDDGTCAVTATAKVVSR